ncbi:MAG: SDR family NAD(P)-dependent oxidoreductase, partial [Candidatus Poseidoniales archaeon]|nr:SDR family NAD(P)-dependent oxidoreductase [Candidatus Poseidoniales archaeon]
MRVAVITGGARRIGATIVSTLLEDGWAVIVHCNRSLTQAKHLIKRGRGAIVSGDLSNDEDLFRIIEEIHDHEIVQEAGGIDLLIHNASIYNQEDFSTVTPQELR